MEEKLSFLWSLAIVTLESLEILFQKLQLRQQNTNHKVSAKERQVYFGALQKFILHHNLSSFGLIAVEIKLSQSN